MSWYLGVDAGGSFTRAAMVNPETGVHGEGHAGPGNPFSVDPELAFDAIEQAVAGALAQVGCHAHEVSAACFGVAGLARLPPPANWTERFDGWRIPEMSIVSDLEIAHHAAFLGSPGIQVIAGTGSSVLVRDEAGEPHVYGGWGWLVGDEGSAVDLGRLAVARVAAFADAGHAHDDLGRAILKALGVDAAPDLLLRLYGNAEPRQVLARLAPHVTRLADQGDAAASQLVDTAASRLAEVVRASAKRLPEGSSVTVAMAGSVFRSHAFAGMFSARLRDAADGYITRRSRWSPLAGAVLRAAGLSAVPEPSPLGDSLAGL